MGNKKSSERFRCTPTTYLTEVSAWLVPRKPQTLKPYANGKDDFDYLQENTNFDRCEILEWHNSFMTECPSGYLTKRTLIKTFEKIYPNGKPNKMCTQLFNTFDVDKNGKIDFCEYMLAIAHLSTQDVRKKLQLTFRIYDSDHNGFVNRRELEKMLVAIYELNGVDAKNVGGSDDDSIKAKVANIFKRFNKDIDESIDENEFVETCLGDEYLISLFAEYRV